MKHTAMSKAVFSLRANTLMRYTGMNYLTDQRMIGLVSKKVKLKYSSPMGNK